MKGTLASPRKACHTLPHHHRLAAQSTGKDNANERNESLLSNCRVQLILCKDNE